MPIAFELPLAPEIARNVEAALVEDVGPGDLTASLIPGDRSVRATVWAATSICSTPAMPRCCKNCSISRTS